MNPEAPGDLPDWVQADLHGLTARLPRFHPAAVQLHNLALRLGAIAWSVAFLVAICAVPPDPVYYLVFLVLLPLPPIVWWSGYVRKPDFKLQLTLHSVRYNDHADKYWELPLTSFERAEARDAELALIRKRGEPLTFSAAGATLLELESLADHVSALIGRAESVDQVPASLNAVRGGAHRE